LYRHFIDQHGHAVAFKGEVVIGFVAIDLTHVGKAGAAAALHGYAQAASRRFLSENFADLRSCAFGNGKLLHRLKIGRFIKRFKISC